MGQLWTPSTISGINTRWFALGLYILISLIGLSDSQTVTNGKDLRTQLFVTDGYDYRVRPAANLSQPTDIYITFNLLNINGLNEVAETMKTTAYLTVSWSDSELQWTPASYGEISEMFWPQDEVWKPDLTLQNSYVEHIPMGTSSLYVHNDFQGNVSWTPFQVFTSTCSMDITFFPFDVQVCPLTFVAWSYTRFEVNLQGTTGGINLAEYEPNPVWALSDTKWTSAHDDVDSSITFKIKLRRRPTYVMLNVFFPVLMLMVLNICVFVLPCDSGEKNSYAVTVFLAFAVFITMVNGTLPENSETIALFSSYIVILTTQSTLITVLSLALSRCMTFDDTERPIPPSLLAMSRLVKLSCCCRRQHCPARVMHCDDNGCIKDMSNGPMTSASDTHSTASYQGQPTWREVVSGLDALCFAIFSTFSLLLTVLFLIIASVMDANKQT